MEFLIFGVFWIVVLGGVGYWIAIQKRRSEVEGAALGCLLGPIGWIIEAVLPTGESPSTRSSQSSSTPTWTTGTTGWSESSSQATSASRSSRGATPTPSWMRLQGDTPEEALEAAHRREEQEYDARGQRVVEAAWLDGDRPSVGVAFGDPAPT